MLVRYPFMMLSSFLPESIINLGEIESFNLPVGVVAIFPLFRARGVFFNGECWDEAVRVLIGDDLDALSESSSFSLQTIRANTTV